MEHSPRAPALCWSFRTDRIRASRSPPARPVSRRECPRPWTADPGLAIAQSWRLKRVSPWHPTSELVVRVLMNSRISPAGQLAAAIWAVIRYPTVALRADGTQPVEHQPRDPRPAAPLASRHNRPPRRATSFPTTMWTSGRIAACRPSTGHSRRGEHRLNPGRGRLARPWDPAAGQSCSQQSLSTDHLAAGQPGREQHRRRQTPALAGSPR